MVGGKTHGLSKHPLYSVWYNMKERCYNSKSVSYPYYGGMGIEICDIWLNDFVSFYEWALDNGWKKGLQIDRKDASKQYSPENCRIVTRIVNIVHRRKLKNKTSKYKGVYWRKSRNKWEADIKFKGKTTFLGYYLNEEQAGRAYDKKALELHGENAVINFPN